MESAKPFVWLGPGVLWLDTSPQNRIVVHPKGEVREDGKSVYSGIVRKAENLRHIGEDRLDQLVKEGKAKDLDFIDNVVDGLAKLPDSADQQSSLDAVVTSSVLDSAAVEESTVAAYKAGLKKQTAAIAASEAPASAKQPKKGGDFDPPEGAGPK